MEDIAKSVGWLPSQLRFGDLPGSREVPAKAPLDCTPQFLLPGYTLLFWTSEHHYLVLIVPKCHYQLVRRGDKPLAQQKAAPAHLEASGMGCGGRGDGWICLCFAVWRDTLPAPSWGPYSEFIEVLWIRLDSCCWRFIFFLYSSNCQKSQAYVVQPLLWDKMSMSHWKEDIKVRLHSLQLAPSPSVSAQSSSCSFLLFC